MSKYCPTCLGEFTDQITTCPVDKVPLTSKKPAAVEELVDVYAASDIIEAELILEILDEHGVFAVELSEGISQIPVVSDDQFIISVKKENLKMAKKIIEDARADGAISDNGSFL